jgi:hypothetical protein
MSNIFEIGDLGLDLREQWSPHRGFGMDRSEKIGRVSGSVLTGPDDLLMEISYVQWEDGSEEIKATKLHSGPDRFRNIVDRHMMSVREHAGSKFSEISITKMSQDGRAGKIQGDISIWNSAAGLNVEKFLIDSGAVRVGTREALEGITNNRRNYIAVQSNLDDIKSPVIAWVLSRALPVYRQYGLVGF